MRKKDIVVFDTVFAQELCRMGHLIRNIEVNRNEPNRNVFFFKNDETVQEDYNTLIERIRTTGSVRANY